MNVTGKRAWIWISVWFASIFIINGELIGSPQEHQKPQVAPLVKSKQHKVPRGTHSKSQTHIDDWTNTQGGKPKPTHIDDWNATDVVSGTSTSSSKATKASGNSHAHSRPKLLKHFVPKNPK